MNDCRRGPGQFDEGGRSSVTYRVRARALRSNQERAHLHNDTRPEGGIRTAPRHLSIQTYRVFQKYSMKVTFYLKLTL